MIVSTLVTHYFKTGFRSIMKNKQQSLISIVGLAVGFVCFVFSVFWIRYEMTYDHFHTDADRIYAICTDSRSTFAPYLKETFQEVEEAVSLLKIKHLDDNRRELTVLEVDSGFIDMFDISFVNGHAQAFFSDPHSALISDREAKRLYAEESPIGKKYSVNENRVNRVNPFMSQVSYILPEYTINGVVRTWSGHSYFSFDYIVPVNRSGRDSHRISFQDFYPVAERNRSGRLRKENGLGMQRLGRIQISVRLVDAATVALLASFPIELCQVG